MSEHFYRYGGINICALRDYRQGVIKICGAFIRKIGVAKADRPVPLR